jgi:hypothetical protein
VSLVADLTDALTAFWAARRLSAAETAARRSSSAASSVVAAGGLGGADPVGVLAQELQVDHRLRLSAGVHPVQKPARILDSQVAALAKSPSATPALVVGAVPSARG